MTSYPRGGTEARVDGAPDRRSGFLLLGLTYACLPFLAVQFVPSTDLPQHLAQIRMLEEKWGLAVPTLDLSTAEVRLFGANTLVYVPMFMLARVLPMLLAGKLTVVGLLLAAVFALHAVARAHGREPAHAVLAGTLLFGLPLYWGFLNFLSGLPLFLWLVLLALRPLSPDAAWKDGLGLSLLLLGLYLTNVLWLPAAGLALLVGVVVTRPERKVLVARAASTLPAGALALYWYPTLAAARAQSGFDTTARYLQPPIERLGSEWFVATLFGGIKGWIESVAVWVLIAYGIAAWWRSRKAPREAVDRGLMSLGLVFCLFALLAPDLYMNTILFGRRFLAIGGMLILLSLPPIGSRWLAWGAGMFAGLFAVSTTLVWALYDQDELEGLREALSLVEQPQSVLGLNQRPSSGLIRDNPFLQTFAYFQALHGGEVNFSFAEHASSIVAYREPRKLHWQAGLEWFPEYVTRADVAAFDCVLVNGREEQHKAFARRFGLRTPQDEGYFRLYCHAFGAGEVTTSAPP